MSAPVIQALAMLAFLYFLKHPTISYHRAFALAAASAYNAVLPLYMANPSQSSGLSLNIQSLTI
jgi:hypothetical protein